jgi:hypothetical protein
MINDRPGRAIAPISLSTALSPEAQAWVLPQKGYR